MQTFIILAIFVVATYTAQIYEDELGNKFYLIPYRQKRQTTVDVSKQSNDGVRVTLGHEGTIDLSNSNSQITVGGFASKQFDPSSPTTLGGTIGYKNPDTGTSIGSTVAKTPIHGTDVSVQFGKTLFDQGGATLKASVGAQQHIGGLQGTQHAEPSANLEFQYVPSVHNIPDYICKISADSESLSTYTAQIYEDELGNKFYLIPYRQKRQTTVDVSKQSNDGVRVTLGHEGTIDLSNSNSQITVKGFASKQFDPSSSTTLGGTIGFKNPDTGTSVSSTVAKTPIQGTDVSVQFGKTLFNQGGATLKASVGAQQHIGGLQGTQHAEPSANLQFHYLPSGQSITQFMCRWTGRSEAYCLNQ
ncbi:unnamed protein product [Brassicogethes aeneus]|uniref:Uncharacterized protein n=1 Tax=Brassicogethes aeneus TaxID=1431903 RepID=A0A9P0FN54_BRAAE|nr:unnamed protein product [Brassicogethes aeneus]